MSATKRIVDVGVSFTAAVLFAPLWVLIPIAVKLDSSGPALFRQVRVGRSGRRFHILKFRTMSENATSRGPMLTVAGDPRVTRVGIFLRRSKLDELPQLFNILAGQMSLVGPRPELPNYVDRYTDEQREVLAHRPGLVDPATVRYVDEEVLLAKYEDPERGYREEILPHKLQLSIQYARTATMASDIKQLIALARRLMGPGARTI